MGIGDWGSWCRAGAAHGSPADPPAGFASSSPSVATVLAGGGAVGSGGFAGTNEDAGDFVGFAPERRYRRSRTARGLGQDFEPEGGFVGFFDGVSEFVDEVRSRLGAAYGAVA